MLSLIPGLPQAGRRQAAEVDGSSPPIRWSAGCTASGWSSSRGAGAADAGLRPAGVWSASSATRSSSTTRRPGCCAPTSGCRGSTSGLSARPRRRAASSRDAPPGQGRPPPTTARSQGDALRRVRPRARPLGAGDPGGLRPRLLRARLRRPFAEERERYWSEYRQVGELLGLPPDSIPATYPGLKDYVNGRLADGSLWISEERREQAERMILDPPFTGWQRAAVDARDRDDPADLHRPAAGRDPPPARASLGPGAGGPAALRPPAAARRHPFLAGRRPPAPRGADRPPRSATALWRVDTRTSRDPDQSACSVEILEVREVADPARGSLHRSQVLARADGDGDAQDLGLAGPGRRSS